MSHLYWHETWSSASATSPFTKPKLEPAVVMLAVNRPVWPPQVMRQPPPWSCTWRLASQAILQMFAGINRKKISLCIQFILTQVAILGSPATYFKCFRDKHEGMRCTDLNKWVTILLNGADIDPIGMGYGQEISMSVEGSAGKISTGLLGYWRQTSGPCLILSLVGKPGRRQQILGN